jgi:hypothetical protein
MAAEIEAGARDAAGAWRFIRRFVGAYATPIGDGDGSDDAELDAAQDRLGVRLPAALRAAYRLFGRRDDLVRVQDDLLRPDELAVEPRGGVLLFRVENQNCAQWGVPLDAMDHPDPPVLYHFGGFGGPEPVWRPFLDRVSTACVEMLLSEWLLSSDDLMDTRPLDAGALRLIEDRYRRLPVPEYPLWADPDPPVRWYGTGGAILRVDAASWGHVRAFTVEDLQAVRRSVPGEWLLAGE